MPILKYVLFTVLCVFFVFSVGCLKMFPWSALIEQSRYDNWYKKNNWNAEEYFDDPKVILLCQAMETGDLDTIDKLIAEGVDVNAVGKKRMQPILWAYPAGEKVFERILEAGGDPNFVASDTYGTKVGFGPEITLLYRATLDYSYEPTHKNYPALLLRYGADPEAMNGRAIFSSLGPMRSDGAIQQFIDAGINLNIDDGDIPIRGDCEYPVTKAAKQGRFKALMLLLEAGAEYRIDTRAGYNLQNILFKRKTMKPVFKGEQEEYEKCIAWLEERGISFEKPVEKPEVFREMKEFRVNDKLIKLGEKKQKSRDE